jgi:hypothetical protein
MYRSTSKIFIDVTHNQMLQFTMFKICRQTLKITTYDMSELVKLGGFKCYLVVDIFKIDVLC